MTDRCIYPIFKKQIENIRLAGELTTEDVRILNSLFSVIISTSFELVKNRAVIKISSKSGRYIFKVSENEETYICNLKPKYHCTCKKFIQQVIFDKDVIMCTHIMAVYLSDALGLLVLEELEDITFAETYYMLF